MDRLRKQIVDILNANSHPDSPRITSASMKVDHILDLLPTWTKVEDGLPEEEGLYLHLWPSGAIDTLNLEDTLKYLKCFSSHKWLGPLPTPPKGE